ncbi:MAG: (2Fe-2S)-binding protein [Gammaproteobacteria bacterium]|nr:MAG: (2Fe-2S)-binding protein [Gammaproteobacteria bacterium]
MALRLHGGVRRGPELTITVDGSAVVVYAGESIAAAMIAAGLRTLRRSPRAGTPRGVFCLMGTCQECLVRVDGRRALACQECVADGMTVETGPLP